ncbi:hypothetical protein LMG28138_03659 [Pararobbsia alpina]|uniref:Uncharacterized protein n=1 Tax=Pararobbsia alpina TaxID=621374 RepID=A0A6S7BBZ4_9BURK|nr:hypothetical protein LMG28138_03659 [Pararobbsia alpina]
MPWTTGLYASELCACDPYTGSIVVLREEFVSGKRGGTLGAMPGKGDAGANLAGLKPTIQVLDSNSRFQVVT